VQPVLSEMREATSGPRQLDKLRKSLDAWQERKKRLRRQRDRRQRDRPFITASRNASNRQATEGQTIYY